MSDLRIRAIVSLVDKLSQPLVNLATKTANTVKQSTTSTYNAVSNITTRITNVVTAISSAMLRFTKLTTIAATGVSTITFAFASNIAASTAKLDDLAKQTKISTNRIQELRYAGTLLGASNDSIDKGLSTLSVGFAKAQLGQGALYKTLQKMPKAFREQVLAATSAEQAFDIITKGVRNLTNEQAKLALVNAAFGDDSLLQFADSSELDTLAKQAIKLGVVLDDSVISKLAEFDDTVENFKATLKGLFANITATFAPYITKSLSKLSDYILANKESILATISTIVANIVKFISNINWQKIIDGFNLLINLVSNISNIISKTFVFVSGALGTTLQKIKAFIVNIKSNIDSFANDINNVLTNIVDWFNSAFAVLNTYKNKLTSFFEQLTNIVKVFVNFVSEFALLIWELWGNDIALYFQKLWDGLKLIFENAMAIIIGVLGKITPVILTTLWGNVLAYFTNLWDSIVWVFEKAWETIGYILDKVVKGVHIITNAIRTAKEFVGLGSNSEINLNHNVGKLLNPQVRGNVNVTFTNLPSNAKVVTDKNDNIITRFTNLGRRSVGND